MKPTGTSLLIAAALLAASSIDLFAARGDLYVSNLATNTVDMYASDGTKSVFASGLSSPQGLVFDNDHNLYLADAITGEIYKYDMAGGRTTFYSGLSVPMGLAMEHWGNLLVAESGTGRALIIPLDQGPARTFIDLNPDYPVRGVAATPGTRFATLGSEIDWISSNGWSVGMYFDGDAQGITAVPRNAASNVTGFVSVSNGEIWLINVNVQWKQLFASGLSDPNGMAFLPGRGNGGELYVADRGTGQIWKYDLKGTSSVFVGDAGTPNFLAFDK